MMEKISFNQAREITTPNPFTLICTQTPEVTTNMAAVFWWTYLSFEPELIGFAMQKTSFSGEMVKNYKKVILAMPSAEMAQQALSCGTVSGRDTDKVKAFGIEMADVPGSEIQIPAKTCLAYECSLKDVVEVGDHYLYVCNVDQIVEDMSQKAILVWDGKKDILQPAKAGN